MFDAGDSRDVRRALTDVNVALANPLAEHFLADHYDANSRSLPGCVFLSLGVALSRLLVRYLSLSLSRLLVRYLSLYVHPDSSFACSLALPLARSSKINSRNGVGVRRLRQASLSASPISPLWCERSQHRTVEHLVHPPINKKELMTLIY